jgi:hypothetical protein
MILLHWGLDDPFIRKDDEDDTCLQLSLDHIGEQKPEMTAMIFYE